VVKRKPKIIVQVEINAAPAWLLDNGLVTRDRSQAHRWDTYSEASAYVLEHLDPKTPRDIHEAP
jgi:hypothetical protein